MSTTQHARVPIGWSEVKLDYAAEILDHLRIPVSEEVRAGRRGNVPYYGANGLQGYIDTPLFNEPLVLLAEDGGNFDEYAARPIAYRIDGPSWVNNHAHILRGRNGSDLNFLFFTLEHRDIRRYISGGTRTKLTQAELRAIEILYPPHVEQRRIAEILDTADEAIRRTEQVIDKLTLIKQGLLHDLLTCGIDENGELRDPVRNPKQFKDSPLGKIPKAWEVKRIGDVAVKTQDGTHFSPKSTTGPYRYITSKNIRFGFLDLADCAWISEADHKDIYARCDVRQGDILLTKDGANTGNATINPLTESFSLLSSVAMLRFDCKTCHADFVLHYLLSPRGQRQMTDMVSGNAITRITLAKINNMPIVVPPVTEQRLIADALNEHDARQRAEEEHMLKLKSIKRGLMDDLLSGRVRVKA